MSLSCNVMKDIYVLYNDNALSNKTRDEVNEHLKECADCRGYYDEMRRLLVSRRHTAHTPRISEPDYSAVAKKLRRDKIRCEIIRNAATAAALTACVLVTAHVLKSENKE